MVGTILCRYCYDRRGQARQGHGQRPHGRALRGTPRYALAALIADELAIGIADQQNYRRADHLRASKVAGQSVNFDGLLGRAPMMALNRFSVEKFIDRGGLPAPISALRNQRKSHT
ncbi:hypothetical protein DFAR_3300003 [Desulfarculales bacterium]